MLRVLRRLDPTKGDPILMLVGAVVLIDAVAPRTITSDLRKLRKERKLEAFAIALWLYSHTKEN